MAKFFHDTNWTTPELAGMAALSVTPKVHLFTGNPVLTNTNAVGDFTEATYAGYAVQTLTIGTAVIRQADGQLVVQATVPAVFKPTSSATPNVVTGYFVTDTGNANVLWAERFPVPHNMADGNSFIALTIYLGLNGQGGTSDSVGT